MVSPYPPLPEGLATKLKTRLMKLPKLPTNSLLSFACKSAQVNNVSDTSGLLVSSSKKRGGKHDCVEWHIVLAHKLIQFDILRILPPLVLVIRSVTLGDGDVSNRRIEPHVEYLVPEAIMRNLNPPLEIPRNAALPKPLSEPGICDLNRILAPTPLHRCLTDILFWELKVLNTSIASTATKRQSSCLEEASPLGSGGASCVQMIQQSSKNVIRDQT
ncbi:uncharacterized protein LOC121052937 [Rosa chinensis]|uniref:uncharacterized protein LOC121052937 n=1 Tax=Rosa chinensis TaxID=74649 RepID=UPI001AD8E26B|nr:uncharacterized protein LOC121052937 [Rosa chinensis]